MALILSIETSTKICSVALHKDGILLGLSEIFLEKSHSRIIIDLVTNLIKNIDHNLSDLNAIAISKGPGSYTGLRIGVSTAKGVCFALDKPLIAVNTLEAMAYTVQEYNLQNALLCPMIDARRMEVYCAVFDKGNETLQETQAKIIDESSFDDILQNQKMIFFGDGAGKCKSVLAKYQNAIFLDQVYPSAKSVGVLASSAFQKNKFENLISFEPYYLKDFISK